eukprot:gnl/MRDRNA2_/MRDRNA2_222814_c0_seq1.p1 gnl/MRDRNA2_/MRDRNA2_222814_c0~~gnl/MRDRNA2_/MRDRNA2_222814_c0_seq1.p1  ORF type:complete len:302 (+),score=15.79 gnl/MRDRNA2_/MRDRNA2_222814_c0_seq1:58-906(+)
MAFPDHVIVTWLLSYFFSACIGAKIKTTDSSYGHMQMWVNKASVTAVQNTIAPKPEPCTQDNAKFLCCVLKPDMIFGEYVYGKRKYGRCIKESTVESMDGTIQSMVRDNMCNGSVAYYPHHRALSSSFCDANFPAAVLPRALEDSDCGGNLYVRDDSHSPIMWITNDTDGSRNYVDLAGKIILRVHIEEHRNQYYAKARLRKGTTKKSAFALVGRDPNKRYGDANGDYVLEPIPNQYKFHDCCAIIYDNGYFRFDEKWCSLQPKPRTVSEEDESWLANIALS